MRYCYKCYKCNRYIQFENLFSFPKLVYFLKSVKWNKFGIKKFPACNVCIVLYLIRLIYGPYSAYIANVIHSKDSYISNGRGWPWTDFFCEKIIGQCFHSTWCDLQHSSALFCVSTFLSIIIIIIIRFTNANFPN